MGYTPTSAEFWLRYAIGDICHVRTAVPNIVNVPKGPVEKKRNLLFQVSHECVEVSQLGKSK
jgi:hypothetical protein